MLQRVYLPLAALPTVIVVARNIAPLVTPAAHHAMALGSVSRVPGVVVGAKMGRKKKVARQTRIPVTSGEIFLQSSSAGLTRGLKRRVVLMVVLKR